jgi:Low molecular weight phosphotyrosine protein phosphatase
MASVSPSRFWKKLSCEFLFRWLVPGLQRTAPEIVVPHGEARRFLMDTVLFACIHSAGRSQMAAAWFNKMCDRTRARVISAGTQPGEHVHPEVVAVMREEGIDLNGIKPQFLSAELAQQATLL